MSSYDPKLVGNNIRILRGARTQKQMAEASGTHTSLWGQYERGRPMSLPSLFRICTEFSWSIDEVVGMKPMACCVDPTNANHRELKRQANVTTYHNGTLLYLTINGDHVVAKQIEWKADEAVIESTKCKLIREKVGAHFFFKKTRINLL